tara:strand:+ start:7430 stop:7909 length:480 start_codon:yes stop_codon:yes gene_type:complete
MGTHTLIEHPLTSKDKIMRNRKLDTFPYHLKISTRWKDNDVYGHINNVNYYSFFDTAVNQFLIEKNILNIAHSKVIGLVVETQCQYFSPIAFPDNVQVGICVTKLGRSSVRYEVAIYKEDAELPSAAGYFVHVYVDRALGVSVPIPDLTCEALATLLIQ